MAFYVFLLSLLGVASAADSSGILKVNANVKGAEVYLDGAAVGAAPLLKYVPVGSHALRVVADNHDPFVRTITVESDKTIEVNAQLQAGKGTVEFAGPEGTSVSFNGKTLTLPVRIPSPAAGAFPWTANAPGGLLDGVDIGVTPAKKRDVQPGKHGVQVTMEGFATVYESVDTTGGKRGTVDVKLGEAGAAINISTGSADAQVFLDDAPAGTGAKVQLPLVAPGRVTVTVIKGTDTASGTFRIPDQGHLDLEVSGRQVMETKPLTKRWGFWAAVGGGAVAAGAGVAVVAVATAPEPPPAGDTVVRLP